MNYLNGTCLVLAITSCVAGCATPPPSADPSFPEGFARRGAAAHSLCVELPHITLRQVAILDQTPVLHGEQVWREK